MPKRFYPTPVTPTKSTSQRAIWIAALCGTGLLVVVLLAAEFLRTESPSAVAKDRTRIATTEDASVLTAFPDSTTLKATLEEPVVRETTASAVDTVVVSKPESARTTIEEIAKTEPMPAPLPTVTLFNGCGVKGIGSRAQAALERMGFTVVDVRNARRYDFKFSEVLDRVESREAGRVLADSLGIKHKFVAWDTTRSDAGADVSLIIGKDYHKLRWKF
ncbi:MAG: LytR C-terminal domain-containing protein [bacterium]|nr:LytR C-terminal domain-containing protein [bacterium]